MSNLNKKYSCTQEGCSAAFARWDRFEIHVRTHSGERPFVCSFENCDKTFGSSSHLKRHEVAHETSFKCPEENCSEILKTKDTLRKHLDVYHHKKKHKKYKCSHCDQEFNKHNWLQRHVFKHTGDHPYKCPVENCGKGFLMPSRLKTHMRCHAGYTCGRDNCDKVMTTWSLYLKHIRENHPAEHRCDVCDRVFASKCNLKQHKAVHEASRGVFPCTKPNCTRFYHSIKNLNWHVRHYHDARPYVCDRENCHRGFKTEEKLSEHMMTHIRRKRYKKKKPKPSFTAILAGCAQKRRVNRRPHYHSTTTESSTEYSSDSDDLDTVESTTKNLPAVMIHQQSEKLNEEPVASTSTCEYTGSTDLENKPSLPKKRAAVMSQPPATSGQSDSEILDDVTSPDILDIGPLEHRACPSLPGPSISDAGRLSESMQSNSDSVGDRNSSEYETITVTVYDASDYKNSESDISSCLSESEDFMKPDMRASRH